MRIRSYGPILSNTLLLTDAANTSLDGTEGVVQGLGDGVLLRGDLERLRLGPGNGAYSC